MQKVKDLLKRLADYFNVHWIKKTIVLFIPTIWLPFFIKYWGDALGLSQDGELSKFGILITTIIFGLVLFINVLSSYKAKLEKDRELQMQLEMKQLKSNLSICETVMDSIYDICDVKYDTLLDYMEGIETNKTCEKPFLSTVHPTKQLKAISDELAKCFSEITDIRKNELIVSMAYSLSENNWKWVDFRKLHGCATLEELINNPRSTFYQVYSGKSEFVFYNNKAQAEQMGNYVFDTKDNSHRNIGSIICQRIEVGTEDKIQAVLVLSISSYGKKFVQKDESEENIRNVENTIRNVILKQFEKRICIELSDLFIQETYRLYKTLRGPEINEASFTPNGSDTWVIIRQRKKSI